MTNSLPPSSPNAAMGPAASPLPKSAGVNSFFQPIDAAPPSPSSNPSATMMAPFAQPQPVVPPPLSPPVSPSGAHSYYSTTSSYSPPWSPAGFSSISSATASMTASTTVTPMSSPSSSARMTVRRVVEDDAAMAGIQDLFIERNVTESYRLQSAKHRSLELLGAHADTVEKNGGKKMPGVATATSFASMQMNRRQVKELGQAQRSSCEKDLYWTPSSSSPIDYDDNTEEKEHPSAAPNKTFVERNVVESMRLHESKTRSLALLETYAETGENKAVKDAAFRGTRKEICDNQKTHRRKNMHMMASSTRKKKQPPQPTSHDDEEGGGSIAEMKSQLDIDREKAAEKQALLLLDIMAMF